MSKSLIELAYECVSSSKEPVAFSKIWNYIKENSDLSEEELNKRVGQFFTNMMLDGRFVTLGDNEWDLRERHTFDKVHIDMRDVYSDVQTSDEDSEEKEEEEEYNKAFEEPKEDEIENEEESSEEEDSEEEKF